MHGRPLTLDCVQGGLIVSSEVLQPLAHDQSQLDLIVEVDTSGPDDRSLARQQDGRRWLQEEEGLLWTRTVQLGDVVSASIYCVNYGLVLWANWMNQAVLRIVPANADDLTGLFQS